MPYSGAARSALGPSAFALDRCDVVACQNTCEFLIVDLTIAIVVCDIHQVVDHFAWQANIERKQGIRALRSRNVARVVFVKRAECSADLGELRAQTLLHYLVHHAELFIADALRLRVCGSGSSCSACGRQLTRFFVALLLICDSLRFLVGIELQSGLHPLG